MEKTYLSKEGYEKLLKELEALKKKRPLLAKAIGIAREHGDLKENAEYDAAKNEQGMNEMRISQFEDRLGGVVIIDESKMPKDEVLIGTTVLLQDMGSKEKVEYTLVSQLESDFSKGKISIESPVGKGLMNHKVNDIADINVPAGFIKYKILKISRK